MKTRNKILSAIATGIVLIGATAGACDSDADVASRNISKDADNFKVLRRTVFYNGITDTYILAVEGYCSIGNNDRPNELTITCKVGEGKFKKHFLGKSDNVTWFSEQIDAVNVSTSHYKAVFKPSAIVPDVEVR